MRRTCALCGSECFGNRFGLCQNCLKEWTVTGSIPVPNWLATFSREHNNLERHYHNGETVFSDLPESATEPVYIEPMYAVIEEKYHKIKRRRRPRKLIKPIE